MMARAPHSKDPLLRRSSDPKTPDIAHEVALGPEASDHRAKSVLVVRIGAVLAFVAIAAGAFGAHGLEGRVTPRQLAVWETAARYHFSHAIALVLVGVLLRSGAMRSGRCAGWFLAGALLFSGSLYAIGLGGPSRLGVVTPFGGLSFLVGWLFLAFDLQK